MTTEHMIFMTGLSKGCALPYKLKTHNAILEAIKKTVERGDWGKTGICHEKHNKKSKWLVHPTYLRG